eukprot:TRINITY_DN82217_c0_g1_i1.p1 TRINITY_DN82217_c0_g1~~TRINITY_DN82217_c0_g1_i1.p1  ORF type:complete len:402 (+),score=59.94 TRINITY_DN82217_c0_g1_i1:664-1869(+)
MATEEGQTEVEIFLNENNLPEWIDGLKKEGYDDLEDLRALCLNETALFESIITKPGHRKKLLRLLQGEAEPEPAKPVPVVAPQSGVTPHRQNGGKIQSSLPDDGRPRPLLSPAAAPPEQDNDDRTSEGSTPRSMVSQSTLGWGQVPVSAPLPPRVTIPPLPHAIEKLRDLPSTNAREDMALLKVIVVGESGCGKTSYIRQLVEGKFSPNIRSTVGLDFSEKRFVMKDSAITVQFWDISGQERFTSMTRSYYKGAHGAIVCYDLTRPKSFEMVEKWKRDIDSKVFFNEREDVPIPAILMGNKRDLEKKVELSNTQLAKYCADNRFIGWFETSAKTNFNVRQAAEYLVTEIMKLNPLQQPPPPQSDNIIILTDPTKQPPKPSEGPKGKVPAQQPQQHKKGCCA